MSTIAGTRPSAPIMPAGPEHEIPGMLPTRIASSASGSDMAGTSKLAADDHEQADAEVRPEQREVESRERPQPLGHGCDAPGSLVLMSSLRRHYPNQVRRVEARSQPPLSHRRAAPQFRRRELVVSTRAPHPGWGLVHPPPAFRYPGNARACLGTDCAPIRCRFVPRLRAPASARGSASTAVARAAPPRRRTASRCDLVHRPVELVRAARTVQRVTQRDLVRHQKYDLRVEGQIASSPSAKRTAAWSRLSPPGNGTVRGWPCFHARYVSSGSIRRARRSRCRRGAAPRRRDLAPRERQLGRLARARESGVDADVDRNSGDLDAELRTPQAGHGRSARPACVGSPFTRRSTFSVDSAWRAITKSRIR